MNAYKKVMRNLTKIRVITEPFLNKCKIVDCVYRPFDMQVFGRKGYSLVLYNPQKHKMHGVNFGDKTPTKRKIISNTKQTIKVIT